MTVHRIAGGVSDHDDLTGVSDDDHHAQAHAAASHSDQFATGAELDTLTDGSNADALHAHGRQGFVGVEVYNSLAQTIGTGVHTAVEFDVEQEDSDAFHDTVTNNSRLTVPAGLNGRYAIHGQIMWTANASGFRILTIRVDNAAVAQNVQDNSAQVRTMGIGYIINLAAASYVELFAYQDTGGDLTVRGNDTWVRACHLGMHYLGP